MPINKIRVAGGVPITYTGEWAAFVFDSSTGGLKYASRDSVLPTRQLATTVKVPLAGATIHAASGGVISWVNPEPVDIIVLQIICDITTVATGACTLDVGYTASSATTTSDTFLDGIDANAAIATFDSMNAALDSGANAKAQKCAVGKWITLDEKTGDATGLVGNLYITYQVV